MRRGVLLALCLGFAMGFGALGVWQLERRTWKLELIQRVETRIHAPPQSPPGRAEWGAVNARDHEYRRVRVSGVLLNEHETLVQAVTELGPGWWVLTPLRTDEGIVLINRGFAPPERKASAPRQAAAGPVTITGLIRMTEPRGGFLRRNDPAEDRWYSRDVDAIARARRLSDVAPFFIDADASEIAGGYPIGGLTVVSFRNAHLVYALTWFALALLCLLGVKLLLQRKPAA